MFAAVLAAVPVMMTTTPGARAQAVEPEPPLAARIVAVEEPATGDGAAVELTVEVANRGQATIDSILVTPVAWRIDAGREGHQGEAEIRPEAVALPRLAGGVRQRLVFAVRAPGPGAYSVAMLVSSRDRSEVVATAAHRFLAPGATPARVPLAAAVASAMLTTAAVLARRRRARQGRLK
ncbi:MAG: hypothetical protein JNK67_30105 [Alphaproteobacteria bacterium]|nr:hypothetical protein [Alphaproteobacteria bacterium]